MAVIVNAWTRQNPLTVQGRTGDQSIKFVPAPRVFIKAAESTSAAPVQNYYTKSNGVAVSGWDDLGIIEGLATLTYNKTNKDVKTGVDQILRLRYIGEKTAELEASFSQFGDYTFEKISGLTASVISAGSIIAYRAGEEDVINRALLLVAQNKLDGKEWQLYNPSAYMSFSYNLNGDFLELKFNAALPAFTPAGQTSECLFHKTFFA